MESSTDEEVDGIFSPIVDDPEIQFRRRRVVSEDETGRMDRSASADAALEVCQQSRGNSQVQPQAFDAGQQSLEGRSSTLMALNQESERINRDSSPSSDRGRQQQYFSGRNVSSRSQVNNGDCVSTQFLSSSETKRQSQINARHDFVPITENSHIQHDATISFSRKSNQHCHKFVADMSAASAPSRPRTVVATGPGVTPSRTNGTNTDHRHCSDATDEDEAGQRHVAYQKTDRSNKVTKMSNFQDYRKGSCKSDNNLPETSDSDEDVRRCRDNWDFDYGEGSVCHGVRTLNVDCANDANRVQLKGTPTYHGVTGEKSKSHRGVHLHRRTVIPGTTTCQVGARAQKLSRNDCCNTGRLDRLDEREQQSQFQRSESTCPKKEVPTVKKAFSKETSSSKCYVPQVKLGTYKGDTCLETFLAKFENISSYLKWQPDDRLFYLQNCLEGAAGQILWDAGQLTSDVAIIRLLRARFGNQNQAERFRAELRARRRKKGETLQSLYQDICRMLALAYPGPSNATTHLVGRDAFLDALDNHSMRVRILEREPGSLDEALSLACRFEAYDRTCVSSENDGDEDRYKTKSRHVRQVVTKSEPDEMATSLCSLSKQMSELRQIVEKNQADIVHNQALLQSAASEMESSRHSNMRSCGEEGNFYGKMNKAFLPNGVVTSDPAQFFSNHTTGPVRVPVDHTGEHTTAANHFFRTSTQAMSKGCFKCGDPGHWKRECPKRKSVNTTPAHLKVIAADMPPAEIYLKARIYGKEIACLLDTGCERSIISRKLIPDAVIDDLDISLHAANGTVIPILGVTRLNIDIKGLQITTDFVVTEALEELILGVDWLTTNRCQWNFNTATLLLHGQEIKLHRRASRAFVRRIYVKSDMVVPPRQQVNVPVKMTCNSLRMPHTDWVLEAKALRHGVLSARTLLKGVHDVAAVPIVNCSDTAHRLRANECIGCAEPANVCCLEEDTVKKTRDLNDTRISNCRNMTVVENDLTHIDCLLDSLPEELTDEQRHSAKSFIKNYACLFSKSEYDLGRTSLVQHRIDTGENRPFKQPLRRHPLAHLPVIDEHVDAMLQNDIIELAASPWTSNIVLICKKDGSLRFCVDYRQLNQLTYKDGYPLPNIETCLQSLGGSRYFSSLDLRAGYWQTVIDPVDRDKTAFVTRKGTFRFKVLSFGLANAPALFQRLMDLVLVGLTWESCLVFVDDILVFSRSFEEHIERLTAVFERLKKAQLKLKPSKCKLFQHRISFLGHVVSEKGIEPDPEKVQTVKDWPTPTKLNELRSFVGLASYYRNHIEGFANLARPLHELTKKGVLFQWTSRQDDAFTHLKEKLVTAPVLASPIDQGKYVLDTDASNEALGAILHQEQEGVLRVIAYASRVLTAAERVYCTTRKELLGVIFGLKKFRQFLLAREIVIRTDHAALTHLQRTREPIGQQARWLDLLSEFNFVIQHRPGESHRNSDALSRRPCEKDSLQNCSQCAKSERQDRYICQISKTMGSNQSFFIHGTTTAKSPAVKAANNDIIRQSSPLTRVDVGTDITSTSSAESNELRDEMKSKPMDNVARLCNITTVVTPSNTELNLSLDDIRAAQQADESISPIIVALAKSSDKPGQDFISDKSNETRAYWAQWSTLTLENGILYRRFFAVTGEIKYLQVIVPDALRGKLVEAAHGGLTGGHFGARRTQDQVQRRAYWMGWRKYVEDWCKRCNVCNQVHRGKPPRQGYLKPLESNGPLDRLHLDLCGPFPRSNGYAWIMTCLDAYTRYLIAVPIRDKTATTVADALIQNVFCRIGLCRQILSDLGPEFQNDVIRSVCQQLNIRQLRTTSYRPNCNGRIERVHRSLNSMMAKVVADNQRDWHKHLQPCVMAYNVSKHEATLHSPYYLMHGREAICPLDILIETPHEDAPSDTNKYADLLVDRLKESFKLVRKCTRSQVERMKQHYNSRVKSKTFAVGDLVWYYYPRKYKGRTPKWMRYYVGPYKIETALNDVNFVIRKSPRSKAIIAHIDKLRTFYGTVPDCWIDNSINPDNLTVKRIISASTSANKSIANGEDVTYSHGTAVSHQCLC